MPGCAARGNTNSVISVSLTGKRSRMPACTSTLMGLSIFSPKVAPWNAVGRLGSNSQLRQVVRDANPPTVPDVTVDGKAGDTTSVNVLKNAINPLSAQGGLTVVDAQVTQGVGQVSYTAAGRIAVTPPLAATAPVTVEFTVQDPTKSPDRMVTGYLTVNVLGLPDAPGAPTVVSAGDGVVVLKWAVPDDHGAKITYYAVSGGASGAQTCPKSPCTIAGLTNGTNYRFTVLAHNAVGDSPSSAPSAQVRPDVAPDAPDAPTLTFGDDQIGATWKAPSNHGSSITGYQVTISPAPTGGKPTVSTAKDVTSYLFTGLTDGTSYQVTVVALNASGTPSDPSAPATEVPAGKPDVPGAPTVSSAEDAGSGGKVDVSWTQVAGHGDSKITYTVSWTADDGSKGTIDVAPGKPLKATISDIKLGRKYSATVSAANKAGSSGPGPAGTRQPIHRARSGRRPDGDGDRFPWAGDACLVGAGGERPDDHGVPVPRRRRPMEGDRSGRDLAHRGRLDQRPGLRLRDPGVQHAGRRTTAGQDPRPCLPAHTSRPAHRRTWRWTPTPRRDNSC